MAFTWFLVGLWWFEGLSDCLMFESGLVFFGDCLVSVCLVV